MAMSEKEVARLKEYEAKKRENPSSPAVAPESSTDAMVRRFEAMVAGTPTLRDMAEMKKILETLRPVMVGPGGEPTLNSIRASIVKMRGQSMDYDVKEKASDLLDTILKIQKERNNK